MKNYVEDKNNNNQELDISFKNNRLSFDYSLNEERNYKERINTNISKNILSLKNFFTARKLNLFSFNQIKNLIMKMRTITKKVMLQIQKIANIWKEIEKVILFI